jgi:hypothetical protein
VIAFYGAQTLKKATHMNELQSDSFGTYTLTNGLQILDNSCTFNICSTIGICIVVGNTSADLLPIIAAIQQFPVMLKI